MVEKSKISKTSAEVALLDQMEEWLVPSGFRVVDLDCREGHRGLLRVFIERTDDKHTPPTLDECADWSERLGTLLEESSVFAGAYDLEVSSPGLDRRLRVLSDFERARGKEVKVKTMEKLENGSANFSGVLEEVEENLVKVLVGKSVVPIPLSKVKQANVVWRP